MTNITHLCENCNRVDRNGRRVRITFGEDSRDGNLVEFASVFDRWLCEACGVLVGALDFSEFTRRHEMRPRTMELP